MSRRTLEIVGLVGNGANGKMSLVHPMGLDYLAETWALDSGSSSGSIADFTDIRDYLNGELVRFVTGAVQDGMNKVDKMTAYGSTGILRILEEMLGMKSITSMYTTTLNTLSPDKETGKSITAFRREATIAGMTTPNFRVFAEVDDSSDSGPGAVKRILTYTDAAAGAAEMSSQGKIPFGSPDRRFFRRAFLSVSAGNINSGVRILRSASNDEIFKRTKAVNDRIIADNAIRAAGSDFGFVIDTTETGVAELMDTIRPCAPGETPEFSIGGQNYRSYGIFDIRPTVSAAATLTSTIEMIGRL